MWQSVRKLFEVNIWSWASPKSQVTAESFINRSISAWRPFPAFPANWSVLFIVLSNWSVAQMFCKNGRPFRLSWSMWKKHRMMKKLTNKFRIEKESGPNSVTWSHFSKLFVGKIPFYTCSIGLLSSIDDKTFALTVKLSMLGGTVVSLTSSRIYETSG